MTKQLLIYEKVVPVSKERHLNWSVKTGTNYEFTRSTNSLPLTAIEFPFAATEYTIIFTGNQENGTIMPALVLGIQDKENVYLTDTGEWQSNYIPAFAKRYPFIFSNSNENNRFTLCIDEDFEGCNQEGRGERLFDSEGENTQYLNNIVEFLKKYQAHFQRTQTFCQKINDLGLFEPMQANFTLKTGEQISLAGFLAISREKLKGLTGEQLGDLAKTDELELVYLHLQSMRNLSKLAEHLPQQLIAEEVIQN